MIVNWTVPALGDLDGIFEFIARDAPAYAQVFVQQIMDAADRLEVFPHSGRAVPEAGDENVREVLTQRLNELEQQVEYRLDKQDDTISQILAALRQLMAAPEPHKRPIGFIHPKDE